MVGFGESFWGEAHRAANVRAEKDFCYAVNQKGKCKRERRKAQLGIIWKPTHDEIC
jgi:hypothetical protein